MIIKKIFASLLIMAMSVSLAIGYAAVVDTVSVTGEVKYQSAVFEGVYIMSVTEVSSSNATAVSTDFARPTNLLTTVRPTRSGGSVTYKVTFHNNTDITYWYIKQDMVRDYESNSLIGQNGGVTIRTSDKLGDTSNTFNNEDWIPPQTVRDVYITYTFGANAQGYVTNLVNFVFGLKIDAVHDEFLTVLNDGISDRGYEYLSDYFDEQYAKDKSVTINSVEDEAIFTELFGQDLTVNVDGTEKKATVVVRRENVDKKTTGDSYAGGSPSGCEYTVYITVDDPTASNQVKVYAISYTHGSANTSGGWYQLGQLYEGTARTTANGTFDISTWTATPATYTAADGITYKAGQQNGDQYDIMKKLEDLMSTHDQDIFNDINNTKFLKKVYDILAANKNSTDPAIVGLRTAFNNAAPYYNIYNNGQQIDIKRDYTRAEIVPVIAAIQHALDYYEQASVK